MPDKVVENEDEIRLGDNIFTVIKTPDHTGVTVLYLKHGASFHQKYCGMRASFISRIGKTQCSNSLLEKFPGIKT